MAHPQEDRAFVPSASDPQAVPTVPASIPCALDDDLLECGSSEETWNAMVAHLERRAAQSRSIGFDLEREANDRRKQAAVHQQDAWDFDNLARAMKRAPVTFPAIAIEARSGETGTGSTEGESAGRTASPTPKSSNHPDSQEGKGV